jgi:hypothetical protein
MHKTTWMTVFVSLPIVVGFALALPDCCSAFQYPKPGTRYGAAPLRAGAQPLNPGAANAAGARKNEIYEVVSISEGSDIKEYKAIRQADFNNEKKTLDDEYKDEMKKYQAAKKDKKNPDAKTLKAPAKRTLKLVKSGFKSQDDAQKYIDDLQDKKKGGVRKTTATNKNNNW